MFSKVPEPTLLAWGIFFLSLLDLVLRSFFAHEKGICNEGIAWGLPFPKETLLLGSFVLVLAFTWLYFKEQNAWKRLPWLLLSVGGFLNLLDRLLLGCIRDYLSIPFLPAFPSFNLADMMLCLGVGILILLAFQKGSRPRES